MKTALTIASAILVSSLSSFAGGEGWMHDIEAAKKKAAAENKDLFIDFTGSDWCGWCIKLNEEVFQHDPFKKGIADDFILVELDYPRDKSKDTQPSYSPTQTDDPTRRPATKREARNLT
jgi:thioredoxin-related protein